MAPPLAQASHEALAPVTQQAATFALRAIAQAGLFDPLGDYYDYQEITATDERWVVSFVAGHCYRNEQVETCDPYQGRSDHLVPDAWLEITERDGSFVVTNAFGRFSDEDRDQLLSYSEPSSPEPGHKEYLTVRVDPSQSEEGVEIRAADIWAGVLPEDDHLWSICLAEILDAEGSVIWTARSRHADRERGEAFRSGGLVYMGAMEVVPEDAASARITCENFSGETWRTTFEPSVSKVPRRSQVAVTASVEWLLEGLVSGLEPRCEIELFNRAGRMVKAVTKRGPPSPWTRSRLKNNYFHALVRVPHPKRIKSATLYCHEA
jgi:hypothetical protein